MNRQACTFTRCENGREGSPEHVPQQQHKLSQSDLALVERVAAGDEEALASLYDRYGRLVFSVALRMTGDQGSSEEIVQDTLLRLWRHAGRYQAERGSLVAWLLTIAQRRALDELRSRRWSSRRREVSLSETLPLDCDTDYADLAHVHADVQAALEVLPHAQRKAIRLIYFSGLSRQEVAEHVGSPLSTIYTRVRLGMEKLCTLLLLAQ